MRRTLPTLLLTGLLAAGAAVPAVAGPPDRTTVLDIARGSDDVEILAAAVEALGLADALDGNRQLTVFAPTDAAFKVALGLDPTAVVDPVAAVDALVGAYDVETVRAIVLYHVAPGERLAEDVIAATQVNTLLKGEKIPVELSGEDLLLDGATYQASLDADNGVVHVIDEVMLPSFLD